MHQNPKEARLNTRISRGPGLSEQQKTEILQLLRKKTDYDLQHYAAEAIDQSMVARMRVRDVEDTAKYLALLETDTSECRSLLHELFQPGPGFFLNRESLAVLESSVFAPIAENREAGSPIRAWVPGCGGGEEAYSLAMLGTANGLRFPLGPLLQITASDIDELALEKARQGIYPIQALVGLPQDHIQCFFVRHADHYRVRPALRRHVDFQRHDLIADPPYMQLDLISCCNLLNRFASETRRRVMSMFHFTLRDGGYLLLSPSETLDDDGTLFEPVAPDHGVYRRVSSSRPVSVAAPASPGRLSLHENQERLDAALQCIRGGIWDIRFNPENQDPRTGEVVEALYLSPQIKAVIGFGDDELPNSLDSWRRRILAEDLGKFEHLIRPDFIDESDKETKTYPAKTTYRVHHRDGSIRWLSNRSRNFQDERGRVIHRIGFALDVTSHKRAYAMAQQREEQLLLLADALPVLIAFIDTDERYQFNNARHNEWLGARIDIKGQRMEKVLGSKIYEGLRPHVKAALSGRSVSFETTLPHAQLGPRAVHANYIPHMEEDGRVLGFYALVSDITETKRRDAEERGRQAEVSHAQRVATVGEMATNLAHELNQPLGAITSYVGGLTRMLRQNVDQEEAIAVLKKIADQAQSAAAIVRSVRDFVGRSGSQPLPMDMNKVLDKCLDLTEDRIEQTYTDLHLDTAEQLPPVNGNAVQMEQVIINLITNALEAMEAVDSDQRHLTLQSRHEQEYVLLKVGDTGKGIEASEIGRIFNPFHTTKHNGMGMGLSISRSIVEDHGGRLWVESKPGRGSTFFIRLPIYEERELE